MWEKRDERHLSPSLRSRDIISIDFCGAAGLTIRGEGEEDGAKGRVGVNFRLGSVRGWQTGARCCGAAVKIR